MESHIITIEAVNYCKTYGYGTISRLVCSCGEETSWESGGGDGLAKAHRRRVIERKLGLEFSVERSVTQE